MNTNRRNFLKTAAASTMLGGLGFAATKSSQKPDIIVVLADDMGFSSLGCYGGEISTPNLDAVAKSGKRFTHFYNNAKCSPSRISIMSGQYEGRAGGRTLKNSVTMAEAMNPVGYRTIAVGKWHIDDRKDPTKYGFDRHFGSLAGFSSYFTGGENWYKNGKPFKDFPKDFYTTTAFTDFTIGCFKESIKEDKKRPYFVYLAYNAPHGPLQCSKEDYEPYKDTYKVGWDVIREERYKRQVKMGLIPKKWKLSKRNDFIPAWDDVSAKEKDIQAIQMAAYAGVVHNLDRNIGRIIDFQKKAGRWDNTLFLFLSDNGCSPFTSRKFSGKDPWDKTSKINPGVAWANADNTPFRWFKQNQHEGGISTPAIVNYPKLMGKKGGDYIHEPVHLMDVLPTCLDVAGGKYPKEFPGRTIRQPSGRTFLPLLSGGKIPGHKELFFNYMENRALRIGKWKLVTARNGKWELYDMDADRTETTDLAGKYPERVAQMKKRWYEMATTVTTAKKKWLKPLRGETRPWGFTMSKKDRDVLKKDEKRQCLPGTLHKYIKKK